ncbi:MAG: RluA family pseudouridine synthase [Burkholderiales bacterium]|nr:RluA family pseudouridine synthase [Burkholderiales bacterium]
MTYPAPCDPLSVLYQDEHLLAIDKPAGLLAVPGRGADKQDCLLTRAQQRYPEALLVHRLDQATSGLILLARTPEVQSRLSAAFRDRLIAKTYLALVHGQLQPERGSVQLAIGRDWDERPRRKVMADGKPAQTDWQLLAYDATCDQSRVALQPLTGRTHQLRVHLLALGHPIVGDRLYGVADGVHRLMLHATRLVLVHPMTGEPLALESAVPF